MDRYLTAKARQKRIWHYPVAAISGHATLLVLFSSLPALFKWVRAAHRVSSRAAGSDLWAILTALALLVWLASMPLAGVVRWRRRQRLARKLSAALSQCTENAIPLADIDRVTGVPNAASKLKMLIRKGFLQKLAIDEDALCVRLDNPRAAAPRPEPPRPEPPRPEPPKPAAVEPRSVLERIREMNERIEDPTVSAHIERIERATAGIFQVVEEYPDRAEAARRMINYYLPTTLKLLNTYDLMEDQSYQGATITTSRRRIEDILGKLAAAMEQQQDKLFQADALNVESDIRVLETMLIADGLVQREGGK